MTHGLSRLLGWGVVIVLDQGVLVECIGFIFRLWPVGVAVWVWYPDGVNLD